MKNKPRLARTLGALLLLAVPAAAAAAPTDAPFAARYKDENPDLKPEHRPAFNAWRRGAASRLGDVPVTEFKVGDPTGLPTVLHFHGAGVPPDNILVWRMARAAEARGEPIRFVSAEWPETPDGKLDIGQLVALFEAIPGQVILSGHSRGTDYASTIARLAHKHMRGKVVGVLFLAPVEEALRRGLKIPSRIIHGTDDDVLDVDDSRRGRMANDSILDEIDGADHSLRLRPFRLQPPKGAPDDMVSASKAQHNLSEASDRIADQVVDLYLTSIATGDVYAHPRLGPTRMPKHATPREPRNVRRVARAVRGGGR